MAHSLNLVYFILACSLVFVRPFSSLVVLVKQRDLGEGSLLWGLKRAKEQYIWKHLCTRNPCTEIGNRLHPTAGVESTRKLVSWQSPLVKIGSGINACLVVQTLLQINF
jgi:hypothetical protein